MTKKGGCLISFEGGEGAGKTEQSHILEEKLREHGFEVVKLREPGGTKISEQIREVVLSAKNQAITDRSEVLLFQAARAQIYGEVVLPSLEAGKIVLMDRTRDSSVVYQGMVRGIGVALIERLNKISTMNTWPDLTFLLDVSVDVGIKRRHATGKIDRIDGEDNDFHQKVRDGYLKLADKNDKARWFVIDGEKEIDQVSKEIWQVVALKLGV